MVLIDALVYFQEMPRMENPLDAVPPMTAWNTVPQPGALP